METDTNNEWVITDNILYEYRGTGEEMSIPNGVEKVYMQSFRMSIENIGVINKLIIPGTLEYIPMKIFKNKRIKELIIEEGVIHISAEAFLNSHIEKLSLPSTIKHIGESAFFNCNLQEIPLIEGIKEIDNNAFGYNFEYIFKNNKVVMPKSLDHINFEAFSPQNDNTILDIVCYFNQIDTIKCNEEINVNLSIIVENNFDINKVYDLINIIKKNQIKLKINKITFIGYNNFIYLTILKQLTKNLDIEIEMKEDKDESIKKELLEKTVEIKKEEPKYFINKDSEINQLISEIREKSNILEDSLKKDVLAKIDDLVKKYEKDLEELKPKLETKDQINLKIYQTPESLKLNLINELHTIDMNFINLDANIYLKNKIEKYKKIVTDDTPLERQEQVETIEDKMKQIKYYASLMNNTSINDEIQKILKEVEKSLFIPSLDTITLKMNTNNTNPEQELINKIDNLYKLVENSYIFYQSLKGENETSLGKDVKQLNLIIDFLDSVSKKNFKKRLNNIINKYINDIECLKINDDSELEFRKDIMPILEELTELIPNMEEKKDVLNDLSEAKKVIANENKEKLGAIASTVKDLLLFIESNDFDENVKEKMNLSIIEILNNAYEQIVNNNFLVEENNINQNLSWGMKATLKILKEFSKIQNFVAEMIAYNEELKELNEEPKKEM